MWHVTWPMMGSATRKDGWEDKRAKAMEAKSCEISKFRSWKAESFAKELTIFFVRHDFPPSVKYFEHFAHIVGLLRKNWLLLGKREIVKAYCEQKSWLSQSTELRMVKMDDVWHFSIFRKTTFLVIRAISQTPSSSQKSQKHICKEGGLFKVYYILFYCRKLNNRIFAVKSTAE